MFEYTRWCKLKEESALGKYKQHESIAFRYSEINPSKISFFLCVKSKLFNTIHFLTVSPIHYLAGVFKYLMLLK